MVLSSKGIQCHIHTTQCSELILVLEFGPPPNYFWSMFSQNLEHFNSHQLNVSLADEYSQRRPFSTFDEYQMSRLV